MFSRPALVIGGSIALFIATAMVAFAFPSRLRKDPFADIIHLPVPLPINRRIEFSNDGLSLVSIWTMDTGQSSNGDLRFEPEFEFQGQPGEFGLLNVSVLAYDRTGRLIFRETQQAWDGRLMNPKDAIVPVGSVMGSRSRLSTPNFRIPRDILDQTVKADLVFDQLEPGRVFGTGRLDSTAER